MLAGFLSAVLVASTGLSSVAWAGPLLKRQSPQRELKFDFNNQKIRGVNLGGWFVLEPWITPSIFENQPDWVVDEYTLTQYLGKDAAYNLLSNHWQNWITDADFKEISDAGLNFVRIPIGYWSITPIDGEPYVQGAYDQLKTAIGWAQTHNLQVMIDIHGAQGSQNGFDNSGRLGPINFGQGDTVDQLRATLVKVANDYANVANVATIEVLNEPQGAVIGKDKVRQLVQDTWGDWRGFPIVTTFHDAFLGVNDWNDFGSGMDSLMLDTHHYEIFDYNGLNQTIDQHKDSACAFGQSMASNNKWTIAGEFTGAMTDCARWLNGRGIGSRYDGTYYKPNEPTSTKIGDCDAKFTGTVAGFGEADHNNIKTFINAQLAAFEERSGWIFWTWKTESAPEWHMQDLLRGGLFPNPVSQHDNVCG